MRGDNDAYGNNIITYIKVDKTDIGTGIGISEQIPIIENYQIFPNPANEKTNVIFTLTKSENINIVFRNLLGQEVYRDSQAKMPSGEYKIIVNISSLDAGLYFCTIETDNYAETKKIIIK